MAGIDKIKDRILADARASADGTIEKARADGDALIREAEAEGNREAEKILKKAETDAASISERTASAADMDRRTRLLSAKQQMIAGVLESAERALTSMPSDKYYPMLLRLLSRYAFSGRDGEMILSKKDLDAMPAGFAERVAEIAKAKHSSLTISRETREIGGGFILVYGGIEENCSLGAMFEARRDELSDRVGRILFS
ncbi:V-type ATP synthase subunit E [Clostridium vitabionis]|uniref:V-type ATP synthase subunit E n=1 Tax=Clostridium vitabionis TaxID=2784388 RepID=UPI00188B9892|nr:V-type ATP synthase subunit E [Clostridium vitabionis]